MEDIQRKMRNMTFIMQEFGYKYQVINDDFFVLRVKDVLCANVRILTRAKCQVIGILFLTMHSVCECVCEQQ